MRAIAIVNPSGGTARAEPELLDRENLSARFISHGLSPEVRYAEPGCMQAAMAEALATRPELLIIGGGDGTLSCAAGLLAGSSTVLGILPLGTLNHFAKDVGLTGDFDQAVATLGSGSVRKFDLGRVNGRIFLNNCSIGAYPAAVKRRDELQRSHDYRKWPAMTRAVFDVLRTLRRMRATITVDGREHARRTPVVLVSNNRYTGHLFSRTLRPSIQEEELWCYVIKAHRFLPVVRLMLRALVGRLESADEFEAWSGRKITISLPQLEVLTGVDGEIIPLRLPLQIEVLPGALSVMAPLAP